MQPDPGPATTVDELVERLRLLKIWAGDPAYESIKERVNAAWSAAGRPSGELVGKTTVVDCFRTGRRRLNPDLVTAIVQALHPDPAYVTQWRQALQVVAGLASAALQVRVQDTLPLEAASFTGRAAELAYLRQALESGGTVAIDGMPGVGKTQLAIRAARLLRLDRVLFVNLRGVHPDRTQPPADPGAVLEGFLRVLGVPGGQIPRDVAGRAAAYRSRLAGTRTLIILDNAADEEQITPLLPGVPGCPVLVTARRALLKASRLTVDVFPPDEALAFLGRAARDIPIGPDRHAADRIVRRTGGLPLALELVAGHVRAAPGWSLTDHADRLDERHRDRRLDVGVELALDLSYQHLPADVRRMFRTASLHPGQDFDLSAAAALAGADDETVTGWLARLHEDHLLQSAAAGRHTFHDLVRVYAADRAREEDSPSSRRTGLTRLFDHYVARSAEATNALNTAPADALTWLDTELPNLVAVAVHTADHGWPTHTVQLSTTLFSYLYGGRHAEALTIHGHALQVADTSQRATVLISLATAHSQLGRYGVAAELFQQAMELCPDGHTAVRAHNEVGSIDLRLGHLQPAAEHYNQALGLARRGHDLAGQACALANLGEIQSRLGHPDHAAEHYRQALRRYRRIGDLSGEANCLNGLGIVEGNLGRLDSAAEHLGQALAVFRRLGDRTRESWTEDSLGTLCRQRGRPDEAAQHYRRALALARETGDRHTQAWAHNGLGESLPDAVEHHTAALAVATEIGDRNQQARAHAGLGRAHAGTDLGRQHYQQALDLYTELGMPESEAIRTQLDG